MRPTQTDKAFGRRAPSPRLVAGTEMAEASSGAAPSRPSRIIVVRTARWKTLLFILVGALATAQALLDIRARFGGSFGLSMLVEMAQPLLLLGVAATLAGLVFRRPILTISADGLALRHIRGGRWAWNQIERIEMRMSRRGFLQVVLRLRDDSGGATRRRLPAMWTTSPYQLAAMLEAARRTASKGRREDVIPTVEAAQEAHADSDLPAPLQHLARALHRIFPFPAR